MADYINLPCPVCDREFNENDEIVVCPICGTPHHRECYAQNGGCAHREWHSENKTYNADEVREEIEDNKRREERKKMDEETKNAPEIVCQRCGHKNSPQALFCNRCGAPVSQGFASNQNRQEGDTPYGRVIINPFFIPQDPNEEIDGIPAWKLSAVVGKNSQRVIPQFKFFAKSGRKTSFNFFACILTPFYFLYRKMYAMGIITLILELVLSIPNFILNLSDKAFFEELSELAGETIAPGLELNVAQTNFFVNLSFFAMIASWAISVLCGLFANWLYFKKCKKLCAKIDESAESQEDFKAKAARKGGVNFKLIITLAIIYGVICFIGAYFITMFTMNPEMFGFK